MRIITRIDDLTRGLPALYTPSGPGSANPLAMVVTMVYDDPDLPAWTARTAVLRLRPLQARAKLPAQPVLVRQQNLRTTYGVPWPQLAADYPGMDVWRRDVRAVPCLMCPHEAVLLAATGHPVCRDHVRRETPASSAATEWADDAVARLYAALGLV